MRAWILLPLVLAGCARNDAELPADPIARAATCGVVAAASARRATANVEAKLTLPQQGSILHYSLLAGAEGGGFDRDRAAAVVNAMPKLGEKVTGGKWETLVPACATAFPATVVEEDIVLPKDDLQAQAGCHDLAEFVTTALRTSEADYIERIRAYDSMRRDLDTKMGTTIAVRRLTQKEAGLERDKALATLANLGEPSAVLDRCVQRFGAKPSR